MIQAIRGAITVEDNTENEIFDASVSLYQSILQQNDLKNARIVSVIISTTQDLTAAYPAKAIRLNGCDAPLFSCMEPPIDRSLQKCIRLLITVDSDQPIKHIYLKGATVLRPDLSKEES